ncbi:MAG: hypothetical protein ACLUSP_11795 [Christensenellales bacterium]
MNDELAGGGSPFLSHFQKRAIGGEIPYFYREKPCKITENDI